MDVDDEGNQNHIQLMPYEILDCNSASECMYHMHETRYLTGSPCTKLIHKSLFEGVNFCSHVHQVQNRSIHCCSNNSGFSSKLVFKRA